MRDEHNDRWDRLLHDLAEEVEGQTTPLPPARVRQLGHRRGVRRTLVLVAVALAVVLAGGSAAVLTRHSSEQTRPSVAETPSAEPTPASPTPTLSQDDLPADRDLRWDADSVRFSRVATSDTPMPCSDPRPDAVTPIADVRGDWQGAGDDQIRATVRLVQYDSEAEATRAGEQFTAQLERCAQTERTRSNRAVNPGEVYDIALGETGLQYTEVAVTGPADEVGTFASLGVHRVGDVVALVGFTHRGMDHLVDFTPDEDLTTPHAMRLTMPAVARKLGERLAESAAPPTPTDPASTTEPPPAASSSSAPDLPAAPPTEPPVAPPTGPASSTAPALHRCTTGDLILNAGYATGGAGAGSATFEITVRNDSATACTVQGYPGVSIVAANGTRIGAAADRVGAAGERLTLQPGDSARSTVRVTRAENYDPAECTPQAGAGFAIILPDERISSTTPAEVTGCATDTIVLLQVQAFA